ncbi:MULTISPECIES: mechanosensitive ion channel family protein [Ochrobactrum]|uniref:Mechanosensitive ion channel family protein n=1 Tax=Ochrobactrum quorumnocens TaxID=271865 RepID=A0A5N1JQG4_9HYPH|nr:MULTISPECIES: mechanosensitive ion channel family protein [Brucella/Ochrobactrum group]KAA9366437.1 mechanosensitive ion channel family protein [[Ochrobactrum] quorumnocens]MBD7992665.1 mechanosensitive ion channel family protein [Ochrobactrum gallinarum]MDH7793306.1 miniconductance mechanosensitive channel [Ochrobactrum sp. AN78]
MSEFFIAHPWAQTVASLGGLFLAAFVANFLIKAILLKVLDRIVQRTPFGQDEELKKNGVIGHLANIVPALIISSGIAAVPELPQTALTVISNVATAFIILTLAFTVSAVLSVVDTLYSRREESKDRPIKGYIQVSKLVIYIIAIVLIIATLLDRSPVILLSGVGAMAAVLILVFQDTLLSLVASMQIASSNMVRVGDWIEMKNLDANGDVVEIALYTVKVQNFDKTITTIPIRKLITEPMKNYRGMQQSGGRRIKRALFIDQATIRFLSEGELQSLTSIDQLTGYLSKKEKEIADWNAKLGDKAKNPVNTRRFTNIGTFRAYVETYLRNHPGVHNGMTLLVRQMDPTPDGLPLEIYCFTNTTVWASYEQIQSDIFDHLYAVMPEFGLYPFQNPSGGDFRKLSLADLPAVTAKPS